MDWSWSTWWWIATGALVAAEMVTGTFYLLMLAAGTATAALVAMVGMSGNAQLVAAALVGGGSVALLHWRRRAVPPEPPAQSNRDVNLDIGEHVRVDAWNPDGSAQVSYRGAMWSAQYAGQDAPAPGMHVIESLDGSRLMLARKP
jgi:membrane protein implicated in regulation of membrane protease activity